MMVVVATAVIARPRRFVAEDVAEDLEDEFEATPKEEPPPSHRPRRPLRPRPYRRRR